MVNSGEEDLLGSVPDLSKAHGSPNGLPPRNDVRRPPGNGQHVQAWLSGPVERMRLRPDPGSRSARCAPDIKDLVGLRTTFAHGQRSTSRPSATWTTMTPDPPAPRSPTVETPTQAHAHRRCPMVRISSIIARGPR